MTHKEVIALLNKQSKISILEQKLSDTRDWEIGNCYYDCENCDEKYEEALKQKQDEIKQLKEEILKLESDK